MNHQTRGSIWGSLGVHWGFIGHSMEAHMTPMRTKTSSLAEQLMERLKLRSATVSVIGLGYVGLPLAETFAWGGFTVIGFDIDEVKVAKLRAGESYIKHISGQRIGELRDCGRFSATFDPESFKEADA